MLNHVASLFGISMRLLVPLCFSDFSVSSDAASTDTSVVLQ